MLKNFQTLIFLVLCLNFSLWVNEFASATVYNTLSETVVTPTIPIREKIIDAYNMGVSAGATEMLVVWDTWNIGEDSYDFVIYSFPNDNQDGLINNYTPVGYNKMSAVFSMNLDIYDQLSNQLTYQ